MKTGALYPSFRPTAPAERRRTACSPSEGAAAMEGAQGLWERDWADAVRVDPAVGAGAGVGNREAGAELGAGDVEGRELLCRREAEVLGGVERRGVDAGAGIVVRDGGWGDE